MRESLGIPLLAAEAGSAEAKAEADAKAKADAKAEAKAAKQLPQG